MNGVIDKNTGLLLRAGYYNFSLDEQFNSEIEEYRTDVPNEPKIKNNSFESTVCHKWNGTDWELFEYSPLMPLLHQENINIFSGIYERRGSWRIVPGSIIIPELSIYGNNASIISAVLSTSVSHSSTNNTTEIILYNITDETLVNDSLIQAMITNANIYEIKSSEKFNILPNKEYGVAIQWEGWGWGNPRAMIRNAQLNIKIF